jgi:hypothetical protein
MGSGHLDLRDTRWFTPKYMNLTVAIGTGLTLCSLFACSAGGSSASGTSGNPIASSYALDGTWDIASYADTALAPSSVTIAGGKLTGTLSYSNASSCGRTLEFAIQGSSMTGVSSPAGNCSGERLATLTGTRTAPAPDSDTPWNGSWSVQGDGSKTELVITGLSATSGEFRVSIAGGVATGAGKKKYTFVARKR